jgi:hypothetical protein
MEITANYNDDEYQSVTTYEAECSECGNDLHFESPPDPTSIYWKAKCCGYQYTVQPSGWEGFREELVGRK